VRAAPSEVNVMTFGITRCKIYKARRNFVEQVKLLETFIVWFVTPTTTG